MHLEGDADAVVVHDPPALELLPVGVDLCVEAHRASLAAKVVAGLGVDPLAADVPDGLAACFVEPRFEILGCTVDQLQRGKVAGKPVAPTIDPGTDEKLVATKGFKGAPG